jgi:hypothetical protein
MGTEKKMMLRFFGLAAALLKLPVFILSTISDSEKGYHPIG